MNIIDFYLLEQKRLHQWMRASVSDLTTDEWQTRITFLAEMQVQVTCNGYLI